MNTQEKYLRFEILFSLVRGKVFEKLFRVGWQQSISKYYLTWVISDYLNNTDRVTLKPEKNL